MAKRKPMHILELEERLEQRLNKSDELVRDLTTAIEGDIRLGIPGVVPLINSLKSKIEEALKDVSEIKRWKENLEQSKGVLAIKTSTILTRGLQVIGALGVLGGLAIAVITVIDWLKKQGLLTLLTE